LLINPPTGGVRNSGNDEARKKSSKPICVSTRSSPGVVRGPPSLGWEVHVPLAACFDGHDFGVLPLEALPASGEWRGCHTRTSRHDEGDVLQRPLLSVSYKLPKGFSMIAHGKLGQDEPSQVVKRLFQRYLGPLVCFSSP
jgi:hypothetical protein